MKIYIVQKGDTLYEIAKKHGVALADLEKMNPQLKNPDKIMPGMKVKVPTGSVAVKKKEIPFKKEMPVGKEAPINKEMPVGKEAPINKEMPINKEAPINKEIIINKEIAINKEVPVEKPPIVVEKPKEPVKSKIIPKKGKEPIFKEKEKVAPEPNKVNFKHSNVLAPTLPLKEGNEKAKELVMEKSKFDIPMMDDDAFPNMMTPKKMDDGPSWHYPFETSQVPTYSYYQGAPQMGPQMGDPGGYGHPAPMPQGYPPMVGGAELTDPGSYGYSMPQVYQPMATSPQTGDPSGYGYGYQMPTAYQGYPPMQNYQAAPCGCDGAPAYSDYVAPQTYSGTYPAYGTTGYQMAPTQSPTVPYYYGDGTYYPQMIYGQQGVPTYYAPRTPYPQVGAETPTYPGEGYQPAGYGSGSSIPYQPNFPKWGDGDKD